PTERREAADAGAADAVEHDRAALVARVEVEAGVGRGRDVVLRDRAEVGDAIRSRHREVQWRVRDVEGGELLVPEDDVREGRRGDELRVDDEGDLRRQRRLRLIGRAGERVVEVAARG